MTRHGQRALRLLLVSVALLMPSLARGDGMVFAGRDLSSLRPLQPKQQVAAIVHRNGVEKMVIALNFEVGDQDKAVWIFPVPGTPGQTKVDVVDSFPRFFGRDPRAALADGLSGVIFLARLTQVWPLLIDGITMLAIAGPVRGPRVTVHGEVEKWGIHAETVTAQSIQDLVGYLQEKKAGIPADRLSSFQPYLSGQYVLVVAWIASQEQLLKEFPEYQEYKSLVDGRQPCLFVEFATARPYYPLRPTRAYGDQVIPVGLFVAGYVEPHGATALARSLRVSYYDQEELPEKAPPAFTEGLPSKPFGYTTVSIRAPARDFTEDLWFSPTEPLSLRLAHAINGLGLAFLLVLPVLFAALSYVAAGLAAIILRRPWTGHANLGFWNLLTILGLWIVIRRLPGPRGEDLRKIRFLRAFTYVFVILSVVLQLLVALVLGPSQGDLSLSLYVGVVLVLLVAFLLLTTFRFLGKLIFGRAGKR